ncbi:MAG: T9SS type A sorting domain-containing protein [Bacteroidia bacterium]
MKKIFTLINVLFTFFAISQTSNWVLFDHNNTPFINDSITWIEVDRNNVKWIGTGNGLYSFNNNVWTVYNTSNSNIPGNVIDKFKIAYDNTIWFLNNKNGFYKFQNNSFTLYDQNNLPTLYTDSLVGLTIDSNDVFFWSDHSGIVKFNTVSNSVYNINTSNSCLMNIEELVAHTNHTIYGVCKDPQPIGGPPQNFADSISSVNDFRIVNTTSMSINCCFVNFFTPCTYFYIQTDRFGHRFEFYQPSVNNQNLRTFDKNNILLSDNPYNGYPPYQIAKSTYGYYRLNLNTFMPSISVFNATIFSPFSSNGYNTSNSIIPSTNIINFDIDTLNNVWLATAKGLVAYNDIGVVTNIKQTIVETIVSYPNPVQNDVYFKFKNGFNKNATIIVTDVLGKTVAEYILKISENNEANMDVTHLPNGMYYLEVKIGNEFVYEKFLVQK